MFTSDIRAISVHETCLNSARFTTHIQIIHTGLSYPQMSGKQFTYCTVDLCSCSCYLLGLLYIQKPQAYGQSAHRRDTSRENLTYFKPRHVGCASEAVPWNTKSLDKECIWSKFCNKKEREREPNYCKDMAMSGKQHQQRTVGIKQVSWKKAFTLEEGNRDTISTLCQSACLMTARHLA